LLIPLEQRVRINDFLLRIQLYLLDALRKQRRARRFCDGATSELSMEMTEMRASPESEGCSMHVSLKLRNDFAPMSVQH
jgi:hypothetical protein